MGNPSIHSPSYTHTSGSLTVLTGYFFRGSLHGNFEIVFVSWLSVPRFDLFQCSVVHCHSWREKNMPYTSCDNHLTDRMNEGVLKYCTEKALKKGP